MIRNILRRATGHKQQLLLIMSISIIVYSCANMASPSGGDYDFDPPKVVRSNPNSNSTNVATKKIQIVFDELIQLDKPSEKIIVTPPQAKTPNIQAISNRVTIELRDSLRPNTTYTIDFTDAIVDNNEKNALENYSFSFSTGDVIDTLAVSGKVLAADNLEPVKGIYVGLHSDLNDSAFTTKPFDRISRTNDKGEFTIRGIAPGKYRIYALDDLNRSYKYENQANAIAFTDSIIVPSFTQAFRTDTVYNTKDHTVDSLKTVQYTRFLPDNIILRSFTSAFKRQYLQKHERTVPDEIKIYFGAPTDLAQLKPLNFEEKDHPWSVFEKSVKNDTLHYWLIDPAVIEMDTLKFQIIYNKTDSLNNIVSVTDTLNFIDRTKKKKEKKNKNDEIQFLTLQSNMNGAANVYDTATFVFEQPLRDFDENNFKLQRLVDSTYVDESFKVVHDQYNPRKYKLIHQWTPGVEYKLSADSTAFQSYSGLFTNKIENKFKVRTLEEYGYLYIYIDGLQQNVPAFVELLDGSDRPVRRSKVKLDEKDGKTGALFMHLMPGKYYARIILDTNNNGQWDPGDFYKKTDAEIVYYNNKFYDIKSNWEQEESWNINELSLDKQKPLEITKNKPQEKESKRKQLEKEEKKKNEKDKQSTESTTNRYGTGSASQIKNVY